MELRKKIVAGNWKMNNTLQEGIALAKEIIELSEKDPSQGVSIIVCAPFIHLHSIQNLIGNSKVFLGAQNCSNKESGAYTGEISSTMLQSIGVRYVILGHSERRQYFHETNAELAEKVNLVLKHNMVPIFCCGETLPQREKAIHIDFVKSQLTESLFHLSSEDLSKVIIAYEPIWAIGTGVTATSAQAQEMHLEIRNHLKTKDAAVADKCSILYGGSAKPSNAKELFSCPDVDGGLIGGASLVAKDFIQIANSF